MPDFLCKTNSSSVEEVDRECEQKVTWIFTKPCAGIVPCNGWMVKSLFFKSCRISNGVSTGDPVFNGTFLTIGECSTHLPKSIRDGNDCSTCAASCAYDGTAISGISICSLSERIIICSEYVFHCCGWNSIIICSYMPLAILPFYLWICKYCVPFLNRLLSSREIWE